LPTGARLIYARGSDFADKMPNFEVVPTLNLSTSEAPGKNGLNAAYYGSSNFDGQKHQPLELTYPGSGAMTGTIPTDPQPLFTRVDPQISFHWWDGAPRADMKDDDFGVRWTGFLYAPVSGTYQLGATGMNAFEIYLSGKKLLDFNNIHERSYRYEAVDLQGGKYYPLRVDYHEYSGDADIQLVWAPPSPALVPNPLPKALDAARQADAVILVLGLSPRLEGEEMKVPVEGFSGGDRVSLNIPKVQEELMEQIVALGKPTVLVLMNGSAVSVNWARDHVPAIVEAWYPGQAGGAAIADVLFGDYNPAGRLPVTFYKSADQIPPFTDYSMKGKTYRYFAGEPLFPFGFGLSYTQFAYSKLSVPKQSNAGDAVKVSVDVSNTGDKAGEEVVELYVKARFEPGAAKWRAPIRSLQGFRRVSLAPKEHKTVEFTLSAKQLAHANASGEWIAAPGIYEISLGGKQPGFTGPLDAATTGVVSANLQVTGAEKRVH
jgi:beta-glucosidase